MRSRLWRASGLAVAGVLVIAACGDDKDDAATTSSAAATTAAAGATTTSGAGATTTSGAGATTTTSGAGAATSTTGPGGEQAPAYAATLEQAIPEVMKANAIPGVVVLIRSQEQGDWSATFGTGEIGKEVPMSITDYFRIGSNTKTMTSTVILQLVQEGKLALDDPIAKYRPDVPNGENITIQQLAEMRSGLYSYTFDPAFNATLDKDPQEGVDARGAAEDRLQPSAELRARR